MKVLIIGSGGREHVLAWKIKQSPKVKRIFCAPGNGGISSIAECVDIEATDIAGLLEFARKESIDLTVVGPEAPLVEGIVDRFEKEELKIFGPSRAAAQLEGSKVFAKQFMHQYHIPTAYFQIFDNVKEARHFLKVLQVKDFPVVIKAEGLAAGKGVVICNTLEESFQTLQQIMEERIFKEAGNRVVIEQFLQGQEASILAVSDGKDFVILDSSQDHKRIFDGDEGPNTGGMGAYSPAPIVSEKLLNIISEEIIRPTIKGMAKEGFPFKGILYAGVMVTQSGPMVLEYNVRFGDPEAQAVLPRLKNDLVDLMLASCQGRLKDTALQWDPRSCVCVVMSSGGYPGPYETGEEITGLNQAAEDRSVFVFHAGTKRDGNKVVTSGGRVLGVVGLGETLEAAIKTSYEAVGKIKFDRCFFRRDIGAKARKKINV